MYVYVAGRAWVGWGVDHGLETNAVINKQKTQTYQVFCPLSSESGSTQGGLCKDQVQAAQATQTERCSPLGRSERREAGVGSNTREERGVGCGGRGRGKGRGFTPSYASCTVLAARLCPTQTSSPNLI